LGVDAAELLSPESAAEGHHGTELSACEDLERVTARRNLQVDCEFQEASASLTQMADILSIYCNGAD